MSATPAPTFYQQLPQAAATAREGTVCFDEGWPHWDWKKSDGNRYIKQWHPTDFPTEDEDATVLGSTTIDGDDYRQFNMLIHGTHIASGKQVLKDGELTPRKIEDNCYLQKIHPDLKCVWFAPDSARHNPSWYGGVEFNINVAELLEKPNLYYYWIEVLDYKSQSASRILVTSTPRDHLKVYDPKFRGGPWFWDVENKKHYYLPTIQSLGDVNVPHVTEFMFDVPITLNRLQPMHYVAHGELFRTNYCCRKSFKNCTEFGTAAAIEAKFRIAVADKVGEYSNLFPAAAPAAPAAAAPAAAAPAAPPAAAAAADPAKPMDE